MILYFFRRLIFSHRAGALVRRIAWLSLAAITVSVTAFLIVIFVMGGMNESIQKRILALEAHLTVQQNKHEKIIDIGGIETLEKFKKDNPDVRAAQYETQDIIIRTADGKFRGAIAKGLSPDSFKDFIFQLNQLDRGNKNISSEIEVWDSSEIPEAGETVMGIDLARSLELFEGEYVTIIPPEGLILPPGESPPFEKLKIKKIVATNLADVDSQFIFYQSKKSLNLFAKTASRQSGIEYWLKNGYAAKSYKEKILSLLNEEQKKSLVVETWQDRNGALFYALRLEKTMIGIFLGLAGLVAATSILTVLALLMSQKRRDIALLMTLGMSKKSAKTLFTKMGICLSGTGLVIGVFLGTSASYYIQENPVNVLPQIYYDSQIPARVDWVILLCVVLVGGLISYLGAWLPARSVIEIEPSETLRQKN